MRRARFFAAEMVAAHGLLQQSIRLRHALVLAKMFEPGIRQKRFDESALFGRILEYPPLVRAVSQPLVRISAERL